jgi:hypothetical protein
MKLTEWCRQKSITFRSTCCSSEQTKLIPKLSDSLLEPCHTGECPAPKGEYPKLDSRLKHAGMTTPVDRKSLNLGYIIYPNSPGF